MINKYTIWWLVLFLLTMSCEERANIQLNTEESRLIVVEGMVTNENINHRVKFSRTYTNPNQELEPLSMDTVIITDGTEVYPLTEIVKGSGEYFTESFRAVFGKAYILIFFYQGQRYLALDSPPPGEPLEEISFERMDDNMYKLELNHVGISASYTSYQIDWQNTPFCQSDDVCLGEIVYYDLKTIDVHEIYKPDKEDFLFPAQSQVIRRKYSVSQPYEDFLRSILSETEWRGGIFDIERANAVTNLSEGAIGYFAASTVVIDTTIVSE